MIEDLSVILEQGKSVLIKNTQFLSAKDYIQPFVDRMDVLNATYRCNVKISDQISITDGAQNIVYTRVHVQAILPEDYYNNNNHRKVVGMIYGLDTKKPVAKFYIGDIDDKRNLIAFNTEAIRMQELEDSTPIDYSCIQELLELTDNNSAMMKQIENVIYPKDALSEMLGNWVDYTLGAVYPTDYGVVKLATSTPINAYKSLVKDKNSDYYCETNPSLLKIYKACLQILTDENDIINSFEKTVLINRMLQL